MHKSEILFDHFCFAQAAFESSRHVYRREHGPGQVRRLFNTSFTAFELRRYMMNFYFSKGSFTISELVKVSDFSRPTVSATVHEALNLKYLEKIFLIISKCDRGALLQKKNRQRLNTPAKFENSFVRIENLLI